MEPQNGTLTEKTQENSNIQSNDNLPTSKKKEKNKKTKYLILFVILFLIVGFVSIKIWQSKNASNYWFDKLAQNGIIEGRSLEEIQRILNEVVEEGMFNVSINPDPIFEDGTSEGNIYIENIPGNHYYVRVGIVLNDTQETVYQSAGIKPGQYIENITLDKDLPKGDYAATAYFEIVETENLSEIGSVAVELTLHILN